MGDQLVKRKFLKDLRPNDELATFEDLFDAVELRLPGILPMLKITLESFSDP